MTRVCLSRRRGVVALLVLGLFTVVITGGSLTFAPPAYAQTAEDYLRDTPWLDVERDQGRPYGADDSTTGTIGTAEAASLSISPSSHTWNNDTNWRIFTLNNTGGMRTSVISVPAVSGFNIHAADCNRMLNPGASCTIQVHPTSVYVSSPRTLTAQAQWGGTVTAGLTVVPPPPPSISSVSPNRGPAHTATNVTINGSNFVSGATVRFGSGAATNVNVASATRITARTPNNIGPSTVNVIVTNPDGRSHTLSNAFTFEVTDPCASNPSVGTECADGSTYVGSGLFATTAQGSYEWLESGAANMYTNFYTRDECRPPVGSNPVPQNQQRGCTAGRNILGAGIISGYTYPAARHCYNLRFGGRSGWYLPDWKDAVILHNAYKSGAYQLPSGTFWASSHFVNSIGFGRTVPAVWVYGRTAVSFDSWLSAGRRQNVICVRR